MLTPIPISSIFILDLFINSIQNTNTQNKAENSLPYPFLISIGVNIILVFISYLLYQTNKRTFRLLYEKPIIVIKKISTIPENKGSQVKPFECCLLKIEIKNPSSYKNKLSFVVKKSMKSKELGHINPFSIPGNDTIERDVLFPFKEIKKHIRKRLIIVGYDLRNKKVKKKFRFKDFNL